MRPKQSRRADRRETGAQTQRAERGLRQGSRVGGWVNEVKVGRHETVPGMGGPAQGMQLTTL